jgi:uncharacterized membrane protein YgdD (TMEM256/DUF423 family)
MDKTFFILGSIAAGLAVALGAFGAHALKERLTPDLLQTFEIGVRYHMYHALALFAVAFAISKWPASNWPLAAGWLFVVGIVIFSGSLYLLAATGVKWLGAITPIGGVAFIGGWVCLIMTGLQGS